MKTNVQVSIIILSYNPDILKIERTIRSAINQRNVNFEIIVSDDGSKKNPRDEFTKIFEKYDFFNYILNINPENVGTVKNCLSAARLANGEYIYFISTGDMIFDEYTMYEFYNFAKIKNANVCFGDHINYGYENDTVKLFEMLSSPAQVWLYDLKNAFNYYKFSFFLMSSNYILGPAYFRSKNYVLKYFGYISEFSKYVEDNTSTAYSLAENVPIYHLDRKICWYEYGTGISTNYDSKWSSLIAQDFDSVYSEISRKYPKDRAMYARRVLKNVKNGKVYSLFLLLKRPKSLIMTIMVFIIRKLGKVNKTESTNEYLELLKQKL